MNPSTDRLRPLLVLAVLAAAAFCAYSLATAFTLTQQTGILALTATEPASAFSVSQADRSAKFIGTGSVRIRLQPGTYEVTANHAGKQVASMVRVNARQVTTEELDFSRTNLLPSVSTVNFQGTAALIASGLTSAQVSAFERTIFTFKPTAQSVIIDATSVQPGPHKPSDGKTFTTDLQLSVDGSVYNAVISRSDLSTIGLRLYDPATAQLVFDSAHQPGQ